MNFVEILGVGMPKVMLARGWDPKTESLQALLIAVLAEAKRPDHSPETVFRFTYRGIRVNVRRGATHRQVIDAWRRAVNDPETPEYGVEIGPDYKPSRRRRRR